jgi:Fic family protein
MRFSPEKPYNDLPPLPPRKEIETRAVLKETIGASRALSGLNSALSKLPNPVLFLDSIQLQEARDSSAIENIITTRDELFKAAVAEKKPVNPATKEVIHYKDALWYGIGQLDKRPFLTTNLMISLMQIILGNRAGIRRIPGTQLKNPQSGKVIYTPPEGENTIRDMLKNLEQFIHADDQTDPLVKLALIHYQFEAIHPFYDGNGRTGRILMLLYLKLTGLLEWPALYFSRFIVKNRNRYYQLLRNVTEKSGWEEWILFILDMIGLTSLNGIKMVTDISSAMNRMEAGIRRKIPGIYSRELLEVLFRLPYTKRDHLVKAGIGNAKTAGRYLGMLEKHGFLKSEMAGKEKLYINTGLMGVLKKNY